ncbi:endonuclease [Candidatus Woesearchaeota archaeon]|nr:MAG: endonuclease [Candidatus Woesearchaeota archaeon]
MDKINKIFNRLFAHFGPLGWWPVTRHNPYPEYLGGPINDKERFEIVIGAILTQNTTWKNVEKALINLNKKNLFNPKKIIDISKEELGEIIRSAGYYNQKSKKLKEISQFIIDNKNLEKLEVSTLREKLLEIKGVGPETGDSIVLYAFNKPTSVVDTYTKRIFSRIGLMDEKRSYEDFKLFQEENFSVEPYKLQELHALLVEHAKEFCTKNNPDCMMCPLYELCDKNY